MSLFPVPVSGQPIPRGWFARLVRFINSQVLHGDGSYTQVKHTNGGTFVTLTPAAVDALNRASGRPGGTGAPQHLTVDVTGGTATVGLSGSTETVQFIGTGIVNISGNTNGQIEIGVPSAPSGGVGFPAYTTPLVSQGNVEAQHTYLWEQQSVCLIGNLSVEPDENGQLALAVRVLISRGGNSESVYLSDLRTQTDSYIDKFEIPVSLSIPAGYSFEIDIQQATSTDTVSGLAIYPCI